MNPNRKRLFLQPKTLAALLGSALILAACGGSPGGSTSDSATISGVAAAGLPLAGTVTVKDAQGVTRQAAIGTNGSYSIDVTGMTAPFVFRASGRAGGREYVIHSAATQADVGGVINVTPLTDLVLSNIAGQVAASYFERNPSSAQLTPEALTAEATHLRNRLLPVLRAMGVDASVDLLRTPFTPLASALDKALDILRVSYGADNVATITNVVTQQQIQDSLATSAAQEASAPTMNNTTGVATAATDIDQIRAAMSRFSNLFANGLPAAGVVEAQLAPGFLYRDQTGLAFATDLATFRLLIGSAFTGLTLDRIDYSGTLPRAHVSFVVQGPQGHMIAPHEDNWQLVRADATTWRLHGDQRVLDIESSAYMNHTTFRTGNNVPGDCRQSGLALWVSDENPANNGGTVVDVIVTGPGIPASGARLTPPSLTGDQFRIDPSTSNGGQGSYYVTADTCNTTNGFEVAGLANVPDNAIYTFTVRGAGGAVLHTYTDRVPKRPLTLAELRASTEFPVITAPTFDVFAAYAGGTTPLALAANRFDLMGLASFQMGLGYSNGEFRRIDSDESLVPPSGAVSTSLTLPAAPAGATVNFRRLEVENMAPNGREFSRRYVIN